MVTETSAPLTKYEDVTRKPVKLRRIVKDTMTTVVDHELDYTAERNLTLVLVSEIYVYHVVGCLS